MAVGANLKYHNQKSLWAKFRTLLALQKYAQKGRGARICYKDGVPANDTAADNPNALYDICIDTTNGEVYICTAYTADASATTWTQITP